VTLRLVTELLRLAHPRQKQCLAVHCRGWLEVAAQFGFEAEVGRCTKCLVAKAMQGSMRC